MSMMNNDIYEKIISDPTILDNLNIEELEEILNKMMAGEL